MHESDSAWVHGPESKFGKRRKMSILRTIDVNIAKMSIRFSLTNQDNPQDVADVLTTHRDR